MFISGLVELVSLTEHLHQADLSVLALRVVTARVIVVLEDYLRPKLRRDRPLTD